MRAHVTHANGETGSLPKKAVRRAAAKAGEAPACADEQRERLRVALHDGLGQLLTSISFLATSLRQKLAARELPEATQADEILSLAGRAISETRDLARECEPNREVI